jgi:hypothetical protein
MKNIHFPIKTYLCLLVLLAGCNGDDPASLPPQPPQAICDTTVPSLFQQLISNTIANNPSIQYIDDVWMDLDTHQYNFTVSSPESICAIGYQSQGGFMGQYGIEILDITNSNVLYSNQHSFSATTTDYVQLPNPIPLVVGNEYAILRTVLNRQDLDDQLGRGLRIQGSPPIPYPLTEGSLTIVSSTFFGSGGPVNNIVVPYIDLVFEQ